MALLSRGRRDDFYRQAGLHTSTQKELTRRKKYQLLITAFPGKVALPLPKKGMTDAFFQKCQQFWQEHAFLEMDDKDKRITS